MFKVYIIESERGWGSKVDEVRQFDTEHDALKFIEKYNSKNTLASVPSVYWYAVKTW